jgi:hypothetical protein
MPPHDDIQPSKVAADIEEGIWRMVRELGAVMVAVAESHGARELPVGEPRED